MWRTFFTVGALFCAAGAQAAVPSHKELQCSQEEDHKTNLKANYALRRCNKCEWKDVPLTVVLLYHNECNALRLWSKNWGNLPSDIKSKVRLLVVDDNSEIRACNCVDGLKEGMTVLRVDDDLKWNIGGARNLGAYFSCSEYIFMADSDAYLSESLLNALLQVISSGEADKNVVQFNRHRAFTGEETALIHPGMMLLSREMYWRTKGCDEDLVGHYGFTDPLFKHRTQFVEGLNILDRKDLFLCTIEAKDDGELKTLLPQLDRDIRTNVHLYLKKIKGKIKYNETIIRFSWHEDTCDTTQSTTYDDRFPAANMFAANLLRSPLDPSRVFPVSFWKDDPRRQCKTSASNDPRCKISACLG